MEPKEFFSSPQTIAQKQYEALRMYYLENATAEEVAKKFGYKHRGFTTIVTNFRKKLKEQSIDQIFFKPVEKGRKRPDNIKNIKQLIISLRKKYYSIEDIKVFLDGKGFAVSEKTIYNILREDGFSRLPRRQKFVKQQLEKTTITAPKSVLLSGENDVFKSTSAGVLLLLPYLEKYNLRQIIESSSYPETKSINKLSSILSFVALKSSNIRRYVADDVWCMDRGLGLFAGLNVLPKTAWFTSYSDRVTSDMNYDFLKKLHKIWLDAGLIGDTINLDFTTIPYWGEADHLENNWSGKRGKALASMLAVLAHDPHSGIIDYGNTNVMHSNENAVVLEFLDFYKSGKNNADLKFLTFDSKFTNYENLNKINELGIKFITIRRRGKKIIKRLNEIHNSLWKTIRVEAAGNKKRTLKIFEEEIKLRGYDGIVRQVCITGHGRIKPAIIITNDFELNAETIVRKYSRREIVEKCISEQISFFHLNNVSSSMVIKVDFDLVMSILTHNLFRLFAQDLVRFKNISDQSIFDKFLRITADIKISSDDIVVHLKKKRNLPLILETMQNFSETHYNHLHDKKLLFSGATYS